LLSLLLVTGTLLSLLHQQLWVNQQINNQIQYLVECVARDNQREQTV
jgi:hypothetical protein